MAQWGKTDDAANSVLWATTAVNLTPNTTNQTNLFGNTTVQAFKNNNVAMNKGVGQFGLDATEIRVSGNAAVQQYIITFAGSGYAANAAVTVANTSGGANTVLANSTVATGRVTAVTANVTVGGYTSVPSVTIAAPAAINITANSTGFSNTADTLLISTANSKLLVGDKVYYTVPTNNTAIAPLTGNSYYYVVAANTTSVKISATKGGTAIDLTDARVTNPGETHTLTGETATAVAILTERGYTKGAAHTGWLLRTVGTGGRAGRVQYETLVAFGGNFTNDATDDKTLPDA